MPSLDETDAEILRLLVEDGRRPYSDVAERVDLSAPAVSDRVDRLEEHGVIRGFTVDVDRSTLSAGVPVLVDVAVGPDVVDDARSALAAHRDVEHVFVTADAHVVVQASVREGDVRSLLSETVGTDAVREFDVRLLAEAEWTPELGGATFALDCDECGNTVTDEGTERRIDGQRYHFCCTSCESQFVERYETLSEGAD